MTHIHILSSARSGSTYLYNMLRIKNNPEQECYVKDELSFNDPFNIYGMVDSTTSEELIAYRLNYIESHTEPLVIKNHITMLDFLSSEDLDRLRALDLDTIILLRQDLFATACSLILAETTEEWTFYDNHSRPVHLDETTFISKLNDVLTDYNKLHTNKYKFIDPTYVYYEDLSGDPNLDILLFDEKFDKQISVDDIVTRSPSKQDRITNYAQLKSISDSYYDSEHIKNTFPELSIKESKIITKKA